MKWVLAFTTFALLVPAAALGGNGPCTADKLKLCCDSEADVGAIHFCLLEHEDELSSACEAARRARRSGLDAKRQLSAAIAANSQGRAKAGASCSVNVTRKAATVLPW